jgi:PAS domain S-box-containing protein
MLVALLGSTLTMLSAFLAWFLFSSRQRAENRYQKLFDQATDGVLVLNYQHRFISANLAAMNMLGYQRKSLLAMRLKDILVSNITDRSEFITQLMSDNSIKDEWQCLRNDGSQFIAEVSCRKLTTITILLFLGTSLTEKKQNIVSVISHNFTKH